MIAILAAAVVAATAPQDKSAADAAAKFSLDLPVTDPPAESQPIAVPPSASTIPPDTGVEARAVATQAPPAAAPLASAGTFSLDTRIVELIADPRAKAVLDKNLPGLSTDENLDKFKAMSLRGFAPLTGGQLTPGLMSQVAHDLAAITVGAAPTSSSRRKAVGR